MERTSGRGYSDAATERGRVEKNYPLVENVDRALRILEMFSSKTTELSVAEIAQEGSIPTASAYRIVNTLEKRDYLQRTTSDGRLKLGLKLLRLGWVVEQTLDIRSVALPAMARLAEDIGETAILLIPSEADAVCVECIEGSSPIRPRSLTVGERRPYNSGAAAMVLLAHLEEGHREHILAQPLPKVTEKTETDPIRLRAQLDLIRSQGFARSTGWIIEGTAAVAAPIFDFGSDSPSRSAIGSLALTGIEERMIGLDGVVVQAAREITRSLGGG